MTTEPRLTPPIVDPERQKPDLKIEAGATLDVDPKDGPAFEGTNEDLVLPGDEPAPVEAPPGLSPAEVEKGLRATLTRQNSDLEHALGEKKRWSAKVTELRAGVSETERWLRAAQPRTRKTK